MATTCDSRGLDVPFFRPSITEGEIEEVVSCLRSGWLTTGPYVRQFEEDFAAGVRAKHAVALNSCTAALHLAVEALGLKANQAVLVPTMTFAATAEIVRYQGAYPILVDCEPGTLNIDLADAERKMADAKSGRWGLPEDLEVVGIIPVHVGGLMIDMSAVAEFAEQHGLWIVEDAAHALPAAFRLEAGAAWRRCGENTAAVTCFSFYANKTITTGEGGIAVTDDAQLAARMRQMSLHGLSNNAWKRFETNGAWDYAIVAPGYKYNLTDIAAAIGVHQLRRAESMRCRREEIAKRYIESFADVEEIELPGDPPNRLHSWHLFPIRVNSERLPGLNRNTFIERLAECGVGTSVHWRPLHLHPYYQQTFESDPADCPVATAEWQRLISLPIFPDMQDHELEHVVASVREICSRAPLAVRVAEKPPAPIYLSPPHMSRSDRDSLLGAFDSGWIAPQGPQVNGFEADFAEHLDVPHAVALSSGTAALHLALLAVGVGPGDDVATSTLTFVASANAIRYTGAQPVFVDSEAKSWNLDPELLAEELEASVRAGRPIKAVLAVDVLGQCADYEAIENVCQFYEVPLIEDAAEALGATYRGKPAGTFGKIGCFSFNGNKIITTSAGGMLVTADRSIADRVRYLASQARSPSVHYEHAEIGFNYVMSNILAAVGRGQLGRLEERVERRRSNFEHYRRALSDLPGIEFMPEPESGRCTRWLTCITIDPHEFGATREDVRLALEQENIEARPVWKPMHLQPLYENCRIRGGSISERLFDLGLCLPSGSSLSEQDLERVVRVVTAVCQPAAAAPRQESAGGARTPR